MAVHVIKLKAQNRAQLGTRAMKRLRGLGQMPAVIYGHKQAVLPIAVDLKEVTKQLDSGAYIFELDLDGVTETVMVKEAQYDYLGIVLLHVDFARVSLDERVKVTIPLELRGTPKGEADGGKLQQLIAELEVECRVIEIPEFLRYNVTEMGMDSTLHIKDIPLPENVHCMQDGDLMVAMVREVKEEVAEGAAEVVADVEPEVIGGKDKEAAEAAPEKK